MARGKTGEDALLRNCYRNSLNLAEDNGVKTIAFPSISTGVYGFPIERAAPIAARTVREAIENTKSIEKIIFVCFSQSDYEVYEKALNLEGRRGSA